MLFSVCLCVPCYIKSSKQSQVTNPWLLLPHSQSFLSCICTPASVSTLPCDRMLQTLSIMGLPSGYTWHSAKPCLWAHSQSVLSLAFSHYPNTAGILEPINQHSIAPCIPDDMSWAAFVPDPGTENGPCWEQTALSILVFFTVSFLTLGWIKLKTRKAV